MSQFHEHVSLAGIHACRLRSHVSVMSPVYEKSPSMLVQIAKSGHLGDMTADMYHASLVAGPEYLTVTHTTVIHKQRVFILNPD